MKVKILFISDTHWLHKEWAQNHKMPAADILVHAGDISGRGSENDVRKFLKWFGELRLYDYKIFIAGNHDFLFEDKGLLGRSLVKEYASRYMDRGELIYLEDTGTDIWGLKFWGSPVTRPFNDWAFNRPETKLAQHWAAIPDDTDVLITHDPPYMIMDYAMWGTHEHCGSPSLYKEVVERIRPKVHVFGHIHEGYGVKEIDGIKFINASCLDGYYNPVNPPTVVELEI